MPGVQMPHCDAARLEDGGLERVEPAAVAEALDGADVVAVHLADRNETAVDDLAVEEHGARPALALAAAFLRAGQAEVAPRSTSSSRRPPGPATSTGAPLTENRTTGRGAAVTVTTTRQARGCAMPRPPPSP